MILTTRRLTIRLWREDEVDRAFDMYSRWEVNRFLGAQPKVLEERSQAAAAIQRWREAHDEDRRFGAFAIEVTGSGTVAGTVLYKLLPNSDGSPASDVEVGWHLHPDSWGHGYATEAARALLERGFADGVPEVFAVVYPENEASKAVCRRLGMTPLGPVDRWYGMTCDGFRLGADEFEPGGNGLEPGGDGSEPGAGGAADGRAAE